MMSEPAARSAIYTLALALEVITLVLHGGCFFILFPEYKRFTLTRDLVFDVANYFDYGQADGTWIDSSQDLQASFVPTDHAH